MMSPSVRTTIRDSVTTGRIVDPQISVEVLRFGGQKVVVLGEVTTPGVYLSEGQSRLLDVVALAGGPTPHARLRTVAVLRPGTPSSPPVGMLADLRLVLEQGDFSQNLPVQRGDVIFVPTTTIANVAQFFEYLYAIVRPIVTVETGIWLGQNISEGPRRSPGNTIIFQ